MYSNSHSILLPTFDQCNFRKKLTLLWTSPFNLKLKYCMTTAMKLGTFISFVADIFIHEQLILSVCYNDIS